MDTNKVYNGRMEDVLKDCCDCFFDSCATDPPYGLKFMGKKWDYNVPSISQFKEIFRVLKHGAHILVACGTRTQHRMAVNIEDAGFEIRDVISWHYGSGFPKSMDISKAIDKDAGAEREVIGENLHPTSKDRTGSKSPYQAEQHLDGNSFITIPATDEAKQWNGWGTALKPATEFWTLARKPLSENTVAENVLKHGTGGINIDGCRIEKQDGDRTEYGVNGIKRKNNNNVYGKQYGEIEFDGLNGRFPANVIFDEFTGKILDEQSGISESKQNYRGVGLTDSNIYGNGYEDYDTIRGHEDTGGASRFFYCPKADNYERNKGLKGFQQKETVTASYGFNSEEGIINRGRNPENHSHKSRNHHPTVKPIDLMRYLVKLITPKNGIVLDPFCGSGTTCIAAKLELMKYIGIELDEEYAKISEARIVAWNPDKYKPQTLF